MELLFKCHCHHGPSCASAQHPTSTWQVSAVTYNVHFSYVGPSSDLEQTSCIVCFLKIFGRLHGSWLILSKRKAVFYHHINHKHTAYWNCNKYIKKYSPLWRKIFCLSCDIFLENFIIISKTYQELTSDDCHLEKCWQLRLGVEVDRIKHKCKNWYWYIISVTKLSLVNQNIFMHLYFACFFF